MEFPAMQKIIHLLFISACILISQPIFAGKGGFMFSYGCFALEGEQRQAVLKMFKDYDAIFTNPEAFTIPPKSSLTVEEVAMAEQGERSRKND
jgi:hypothetical protein